MLHEIAFLVPEDLAEPLGDALMDAGALSVSLEDADAESADEKPLYGEPGLEPKTLAWRHSRLKLLVDEKFDVRTALSETSAALGAAVPAIESDTTVPDTDWVRLTQSQFGPTQVSNRLWIVPSWNEPPDAQAINIRLDPGVAFGTGSHPTTHLCLKWLDANTRVGATVLDYGCGTGILAIAAAKLGASRVLGTDIDPQAVESAQHNATTNAVQATFVLPDAMPSGTFDIVIANILSNPLKVLAAALLGRVAPGGSLTLSGVLARQADEVIAAYRAVDPSVTLSVWAEEEGWVCISGRRQTD